MVRDEIKILTTEITIPVGNENSNLHYNITLLCFYVIKALCRLA